MKNQQKIQLLVIIMTNAIPLAGVEFWKWNAFQIIFVFWLESLIVGYFATLEISTLEDSLGLPAWTDPPSRGNTLLFILLYFPVLIGYFFWISEVIGGSKLLTPFAVLKPFKSQIALFGASFILSHGIRFKNFKALAEKSEVGAVKYFLSPFLRLILVQGLLVTSLYWIYYRHAALIFFVVTYLVKLALDIGFYYWHEVHIPPVIKDREFFGV